MTGVIGSCNSGNRSYLRKTPIMHSQTTEACMRTRTVYLSRLLWRNNAALFPPNAPETRQILQLCATLSFAFYDSGMLNPKVIQKLPKTFAS